MLKSKKLLSLLALLCAFALLFTLAACQQSGENPGETTANSTTAESTTASSSSDDSSSSDESSTDPEPALPAIWNDAIYKKDTTLGSGQKVITVTVKADDYSVTFTLKTDAKTLGAALVENQLVEGETSQYGLYIKKTNGMLADYNVDKSYWNLSKDGTPLMTGADSTNIADGEHYEITRTK